MNYTIELMIYEKWAEIPQLSPAEGDFSQVLLCFRGKDMNSLSSATRVSW